MRYQLVCTSSERPQWPGSPQGAGVKGTPQRGRGQGRIQGNNGGRTGPEQSCKASRKEKLRVGSRAGVGDRKGDVTIPSENLGVGQD